MTINETNGAGGLESPGSAKSAATRSAVSTGGKVDRSNSASAVTEGPGDGVSLSNLGSRLRELGSDSFRSAHVDKISKVYASGGYTVDASATSDAIVRDATRWID